jgi:hypothetical protein
MRTSISEGLDFLLSHFRGDNALWPKYISVWDNWHIPVNDRNKAISLFQNFKLMDCRICPYPQLLEGYCKSDAREAMSIGGVGIVPNFLFIDLDKGRFSRTLYAYQDDALINALYHTLERINEKFNGDFKPTIVDTGNGYHIYLPIQLSGSSWCLGHTDLFMNISKRPDIEFLRWAEYYLSDGLCDPAHHQITTFNNMYCRIPGSFNSKNNTPVKIIQEWDGQRPFINYLLRDFYAYLLDKSLKPKKEYVNFKEFSTKWN